MTGRLRRVMLRSPAAAADAGEWKRFNYLHPIDEATVIAEHASLVEMLKAEGVEVVLATGDEPGLLDAIFAFDPSIITDEGAILLNMGKPLRAGEVAAHALTYANIGIPVIGEVVSPGTVEGGDTMWLDEQTMAVGRGYRTNEEGIRQLRVLLSAVDVELVSYDLPHWTGPADCLHLLSMISPIGERRAIVHKPLMAVAFLEELEKREWELLDVPADEYDSMGCNVLALAPSRVLILEGNPNTRERLEAAGCTVLTYAGAEISLNRAGGPTCLTRPLLRDAN